MPFIVDALGTVAKVLEKRLEEVNMRGRIKTRQKVVKIRQNPKNSLGDLRRLAVT